MYGQMFNLFQLLQTKRQFKILRDGDLAYCLGIVRLFSCLIVILVSMAHLVTAYKDCHTMFLT